METNRSGNLDKSARWRVVIFKKARAQDLFANGNAASARGSPTAGQGAYFVNGAYSRAGVIAKRLGGE
jgi:hypothetical protein